MTMVILALRWLSLGLALYNLRWTACGALELARGRFNPPAIYLSVVFWFAIVVISFWAAWFFGASPEWRLLSYLLLAMTMGLAAYGNRVGSALKARKFYGFYDHLEAAFAIVDLARVDRAAADDIAAECRRRTAAAMLERRP